MIDEDITVKNIDRRTVSNIKYTKSYASIARMVKQNTVEVHMKNMMLY